MNSVIIEFPGSNCVSETKRFLDDPSMVWHTEKELPDADLYVLPGGFSYGCLLYTSPSPRDRQKCRMPSSA